MSITDPLGDMVARIRNAQMRFKKKVLIPVSCSRAAVLDVLVLEGYIRGYITVKLARREMFEVELKYHEGKPVIRKLVRVSKPGRRVYISMKDAIGFANRLGTTILSTSKGVMADHLARESMVGGEVLCHVF